MTGLVALFEDQYVLCRAIAAVQGRDYGRLDAITPFEVEDLKRALCVPRSRLPWLIAAAATTGAFLALLILWWCNAYDYPLDVGGRPVFSFWTDVPIVFETAILSAGVTGFIAFFAASGLPRVHHPWFDVDGTDEGFWLVVESPDPLREDVLETELRRAGALRIERFR